MSIWNASLTEMLWTLMGVFGTFYVRRNMLETDKYQEAVRKMNGRNIVKAREMRRLAFAHYRREWERIIVTGVVVITGVAAMITPPAIRAQPVTPIQLIIVIGLFVIVITSIAGSALDRRTRELVASEERS